MNIKEAKKQISDAVTVYLEKDEKGRYVIPAEQQRPSFMLGAPGIGKTAIMEQIAGELGVALVSYTMTHHTRQSALGLPFITRKMYGGEEYAVSEYTMSEIIASVYDVMEETGLREGILFLDEINCVSETLAPAMLQFLQYKTFGRHKVPEGWVIVTAGNPPEYNRAVKDFDIATFDRLKRMDVEPDYKVWKEYAYAASVHPAIITYLDLKPDAFYRVESTVDGKEFVTARGWTDLSRILTRYERNQMAADENLIGQYLQSRAIASDFANYYLLFKKYKSDYQVDTILYGRPSDTIRQRAINAPFDERLMLIGLLVDGIALAASDTLVIESALLEFGQILKEVKAQGEPYAAELNRQIELIRGREENRKRAGNLLQTQLRVDDKVIDYLKECAQLPEADHDFTVIKGYYASLAEQFQELTRKTSGALSRTFDFCEDAFEEGQEMVILVTQLTENPDVAKYISRYGCSEYFRHSKELMFYERETDLAQKIRDFCGERD